MQIYQDHLRDASTFCSSLRFSQTFFPALFPTTQFLRLPLFRIHTCFLSVNLQHEFTSRQYSCGFPTCCGSKAATGRYLLKEDSGLPCDNYNCSFFYHSVSLDQESAIIFVITTLNVSDMTHELPSYNTSDNRKR